MNFRELKFCKLNFENRNFGKGFENWNINIYKEVNFEMLFEDRIFIRITFFSLKKNEDLRGPNTWPIGVYTKQTRAKSNKKNNMPSSLQ